MPGRFTYWTNGEVTLPWGWAFKSWSPEFFEGEEKEACNFTCSSNEKVCDFEGCNFKKTGGCMKAHSQWKQATEEQFFEFFHEHLEGNQSCYDDTLSIHDNMMMHTHDHIAARNYLSWRSRNFCDIPNAKEQAWHDLNSGTSLGTISPDLMDLSMCRFAVKWYPGKNYKFVPDKFRDDDLITYDAATVPHNLMIIPPDLLDDNLIIHAITTNLGALKYIDRKRINDQMRYSIIMDNPDAAVELTTAKKGDKRFIMVAVKKDGGVLKRLHDDQKDEKICRAAVKTNGRMLKYVPVEYIDQAMCDTAFASDYRAIAYMPRKYKSPDICIAAVRHNVRSKDFVPDYYKDANGKLLSPEDMYEYWDKNVMEG